MLQGGAVEPATLPTLKHGEDGEKPVLVPHLELLQPVEPKGQASAGGAVRNRIEGGAGGGLHASPARVGLAGGGARALVLVGDLDRDLAVAAAIWVAANAEEPDPVRLGCS